MTAHRRPTIRFSDAPRGECRWCGEPILHTDGEKRGEPNRRRRWHPECVDEYNASDPGEVRRMLRKRDRGKCALCGLNTNRLRRELKGRGRARELRERGFKPRQSLWEVDHIVALIDGGGHEPENLQTLCTPCHKTKTAQEARNRAAANTALAAPPEQSPAVFPGPPSPSAQAHRRERKPALSLEDLLERADRVNERTERALSSFGSG